MEDLSGQGFDVIDKPTEDFETSKQIFRRLAKFHAANFFLHHEQVELSWKIILNLNYFPIKTKQKLDYNDFNMHLFQNSAMAEIMFEQGLEAFIDVAKEWTEFEKYIPNLEKFKKTYFNKTLKTYTPNRSEFGYNVLNHADFHLKNMLFRKNADGAIDDFYFVSSTKFSFYVCTQFWFSRSTSNSAYMQRPQSI